MSELLVLVGLDVCIYAGVALFEGANDASDRLGCRRTDQSVPGLRSDFDRDVDDILSDSAPLEGWRERLEASIGKLTGQHMRATNRP